MWVESLFLLALLITLAYDFGHRRNVPHVHLTYSQIRTVENDITHRVDACIFKYTEQLIKRCEILLVESDKPDTSYIWEWEWEPYDPYRRGGRGEVPPISYTPTKNNVMYNLLQCLDYYNNHYTHRCEIVITRSDQEAKRFVWDRVPPQTCGSWS